MGRKTKRQETAGESARRPQKEQPFNLALKDAALSLKARMKAEEERQKQAAEAARRAEEAEAARKRQASAGALRFESGLSDQQLFEAAMTGVQPLEKDIRGHAPPPPPRPAKIVSEEAEALAHLYELVAGEGPFDMSCTEEFIEGRAAGVDERLVKALKSGAYSVQANVDLHGLSRAEAKPRVEAFLSESRRLGRRCVLIVHGKGLNSKDHIPVLKESLRVWLCQGAIGRAVLAFCTALPCDGGTGAVYVLLRR